MCVRHGLVDMFVFMAFGEVKPNTQRHETTGDKKLDGDRLSKSNNGDDRAQKRSGREIGARPRCAEIPERDDEQRKAYTVAKKTDDAGQQSIRRTGQRSPGPESQCDINRPGQQSLELDNLQRIGQRHLASQIVVEAPHDASADDGNGAENALQRRGAGPGERSSTCNKADHAQHDPAIKILVKDEPGHQSGRCSFKSQQQRSRSGIGSGQPQHQQNGTSNASGRDGSAQPRDVLSAQRLLPSCWSQDRMGEPTQNRHANARSAIKQTRQQNGIDGPDETFGGRRRYAEQRGRQQRVKDCGSIHAAIVA